MIEELPTMEYLQHCKPSLYQFWTCLSCDEIETFNHLWSCTHTISKLTNIMEFSQNLLFELVKIAAPQTEYDHPAVMRLINDPNIWNVSTSNTSFTFVDLIKGFVPAALSHDVHALVSTKALTSFVINSFLQAIFEKVRQEIWLPRCHQII